MNIKKTRIIFAIYIVLLSVMLLFKFQLSFDYISDKINSIKMNRELGVWNINLIPFKTICSQLEMLRAIPVIAMKNILGNIMAFIPFGIFFQWAWKYHDIIKHFWLVLFMFYLSSWRNLSLCWEHLILMILY